MGVLRIKSNTCRGTAGCGSGGPRGVCVQPCDAIEHQASGDGVALAAGAAVRLRLFAPVLAQRVCRPRHLLPRVVPASERPHFALEVTERYRPRHFRRAATHSQGTVGDGGGRTAGTQHAAQGHGLLSQGRVTQEGHRCRCRLLLGRHRLPAGVQPHDAVNELVRVKAVVLAPAGRPPRDCARCRRPLPSRPHRGGAALAPHVVQPAACLAPMLVDRARADHLGLVVERRAVEVARSFERCDALVVLPFVPHRKRWRWRRLRQNGVRVVPRCALCRGRRQPNPRRLQADGCTAASQMQVVQSPADAPAHPALLRLPVRRRTRSGATFVIDTASRKTPFVTGAGTHAHWKSSEFAYLSSMARMLRATDAVGHLAAHAASSLACRLVPWQAQRRCCFHRVMAECPCLNRPCGAPCVRPMHVARSLSQVTAAHMGCARHSAAHAARLELTGCSREKLHPAPRTLLVRAMDHPGSASNSQASGGAQCDI